MAIKAVVHAGSDDAFIAWTADFIADCRGFALRRKEKRGAQSEPSPNQVSEEPDSNGFFEEIVSSWVGFANGPDVDPGTRSPTTVWPIQKYLWSDFAVRAGDIVSYSVSPMVGKSTALTERTDLASPWSQIATIGGEDQQKVACFFNRGIVASQ